MVKDKKPAWNMRIIVDTNILFSGILNTNSRISKILLHSKRGLNFYSTHNLEVEIEEHRNKIKKLTKYSDTELTFVIRLFISRVRFIDVEFIPVSIMLKTKELTNDVDIDDTEFVALTEHVKGRLWSGDKELIKGLKRKGWNKFIDTSELFHLAFK